MYSLKKNNTCYLNILFTAFLKNSKIVQTLFFFLFASVVGAQDRENKALPAISTKILWTLSKATGWIKGSDGQWLEGNNKIQSLRLSSADANRFETEKNISGYDNFKTMEAREITVEGNAFILITKKFVPGKWEFPTMERGFITQPVISYVVIKKNNASLMDENSAPGFDIPMYYWGTVEDSPKFASDIAADINKQCIKYTWISSSKGTDQSLNFYYKELPDKSKCRFLITTSKDGMSQTQFLVNPVNRGFDFSYTSLKDYYYELPTSSMTTLISLFKPEG